MNRVKDPITARKNGSSSWPVWLIVIFLTAFAARMAYLMLFVGPDSFPVNIDSIEHHQIAMNLVHGDGYTLYGNPTAYRAPFLTYLMALNYLLFGENFAILRIEMILISLFLVWAVYLLAGEIFDRRVGLWAALIAALYPHLIFYSARLFTEIPFTLFSVLAILYFARFIRLQNRRFLGFSALFLALAILTRPVGFALLGFIIIYLLFRQPRWHNFRNMAILAGLVCLLISPWIIRNYSVFGRFVPVTSQGGVVLWVGNNHYVAHHPLYSGGHVFYQYLPGARKLIGNDEVERSRYAFRYFTGFLKEYPGDIPLLIRNKAVRFWEKDFLTGSSRKWMYEYSYLIVLVLAAAGVLLIVTTRKNGTVYLWMLLLANFLPALIFWAGSRIRLPAEPVLIIFAAFFLESVRRRLLRGKAMYSALFPALALLLCLSCRPESRTLPAPEWVFRPELPVFFIQNLDTQRLGAVSGNSYFIIRKPDGTILKEVRLAEFGVSGGALLEDQKIYYEGADGYFHCDDIENKRTVWQYPMSSGTNISPVVDDQTLYRGSADSMVYAMDKNSGRVKWKYKTDCLVEARPFLLDSLLIIGSWDTRLYAFQRETGRKLWEFPAEAAVTQAPVPVDTSLWFSNYDDHIYQIDSHTGKLKFDFVADNAFEFGGVRWGDTLIFSGIDRKFYFVDPDRQTVTVHGKSPVAVSTRPLVHQNELYTGQYDGCLYKWELPSMAKTLLHRFDGRILFLFTDGDYLWAASWDRTVVCFALNEIQ